MSDVTRTRFEVGETAVTIASDERFHGAAREAIVRTRRAIQEQVRADRFFLTTMEPYEEAGCVNAVARRMCGASKAAGVGPMATVAGTVAQAALEAMVDDGCTHGWVDNGGDIAIVLEAPALVEVFADPEEEESLAIELGPTDGIIGVCSSSGRLGHSVSLGNADIALAIASSAVLADAIATGIGNRAVDSASLDGCFDEFRGVDGFIGGLVVLDGAASVFGRLPRLVRTDHCAERLTAHSKMPVNAYAGACAHTSNSRTGVRP
jgi:ApbE superfamily uncharacterized protein (UPF0280 family)